MTPTLHIRLLGGPDIRLDNEPVYLETSKTLALLAYLVMRPGPHQREMLASLLWGEQETSRAARSLRRALWNIRHSLCPEGEECPYLVASRHTIAFNRKAPYALDVERFNEHVDAAQRILSAERESLNVSEEAIEHLASCVALYRGDFLEGLYIPHASTYEAWLLGERAYYRERILQVLSQLSEVHTARGEYDQAILVLQRLLSLAPWSEWAHRHLMLCYALAGRRSDALAQYETCRRLLREHLDVSPMPETVRLYQRIRDANQFPLTLFQASRSTTLKDLLPPIPFFGRGEEHAWLLSQWKKRRGTLTLVEGEAGIGKTRLVMEFLKYLSGRGVTVLSGRCYQFGHGAPFHPIANALRDLRRRAPKTWPYLPPVWLTELSRLLPELLSQSSDLPPPVPIEKDVAARQRLFEAVAQVLLALDAEGVALFLDDMHWADTDTVDMLGYLLHRLAETDVWVVVAYRGEEMERGHPFRLLRHELGRAHRLRMLHLQPLSKESVREALKDWMALSEREIPPLLTYLYERSQGNPFILIEHLRDLVERGILQVGATGWHVDSTRLPLESDPARGHARNSSPYAIPSAVQDMILTRVERFSGAARDLLDFAATMGNPFTRTELLAVAQLPTEEVDKALHDWLLRGVVHPLSSEQDPQYDFTHPLIRQVVYGHIPIPLRRRLHATIGEALARLYAGREEQVIDTLAYHFAESGNREQAVPYLIRAGDVARTRQALDAAAEFYTRALEMTSTDDVVTRYRALSGRERAYNQLAKRDAQEDDLHALWELARQMEDPIRQADVLFRRAEWAMRTARFRDGLADATAAYTLAREHGDTGTAIDALRIKAMCYARMGDFEQARGVCIQGLALSRKAGDRRREVLCLGTLGIIVLDLNRLEEARHYMEEALAYWRSSEETWHYAIACNNLSMLYHRLGDYGRALALQEEARDLAPQTGDLGLNAYTLTSLGLLYYTVGRHQEALESYTQALELARIVLDQGLESYIQMCMGNAQLALGQVDEARDAYHRALEMEETLGVCTFRPQIWEGLALCALTEGNVLEAASCLEKADHYYGQEIVPGHTLTLALRAYLSAEEGNRTLAYHLIKRFWQVAQETGEEPEPEAWGWLSQAYERLGETTEAEHARERAIALIQRRAATLNEEDGERYLTSTIGHRAFRSSRMDEG